MCNSHQKKWEQNNRHDWQVSNYYTYQFFSSFIVMFLSCYLLKIVFVTRCNGILFFSISQELTAMNHKYKEWKKKINYKRMINIPKQNSLTHKFTRKLQCNFYQHNNNYQPVDRIKQTTNFSLVYCINNLFLFSYYMMCVWHPICKYYTLLMLGCNLNHRFVAVVGKRICLGIFLYYLNDRVASSLFARFLLNSGLSDDNFFFILHQLAIVSLQWY